MDEIKLKKLERKLILATEFIFMVTFVYTGLCWFFVRNIEMVILLFTALLGESLVIEIQLNRYKPFRYRQLHNDKIE